jgi:hypothetical protein
MLQSFCARKKIPPPEDLDTQVLIECLEYHLHQLRSGSFTETEWERMIQLYISDELERTGADQTEVDLLQCMTMGYYIYHILSKPH